MQKCANCVDLKMCKICFKFQLQNRPRYSQDRALRSFLKGTWGGVLNYSLGASCDVRLPSVSKTLLRTLPLWSSSRPQEIFDEQKAMFAKQTDLRARLKAIRSACLRCCIVVKYHYNGKVGPRGGGGTLRHQFENIRTQPKPPLPKSTPVDLAIHSTFRAAGKDLHILCLVRIKILVDEKV